jgi:transposase
MPQLTRDQRLQCRTLREAGWGYLEISQHLKITQRQVQYASTAADATPAKRSGRPPKLTPDQVKELVDFVVNSKEGRNMTFNELATGPFAHWKPTYHSIRYALRQNGIRRPRKSSSDRPAKQ